VSPRPYNHKPCVVPPQRNTQPAQIAMMRFKRELSFCRCFKVESVIAPLAREGSPLPGLRLHQAELSRNSSQIR
jgi:hypothetical protein